MAGRRHDANCSLLKARLVAAAHGAEAVFPWCDAELIDGMTIIDLGNAPEFTISIETNTLDHYSSREAVRTKDQAVELEEVIVNAIEVPGRTDEGVEVDRRHLAAPLT